MPKTATHKRINHTFDPSTIDQIGELARWWGGVEKLSNSAVIREAIRRSWDVERRRQAAKKSLKISNGAVD